MPNIRLEYLRGLIIVIWSMKDELQIGKDSTALDITGPGGCVV